MWALQNQASTMGMVSTAFQYGTYANKCDVR